jgi:formylglycine-generating enzyme required for sulfatase activity
LRLAGSSPVKLDIVTPLHSVSRRLRRLDFLPAWAAWALGLGFGALAGAALAGAAMPRWVGVLGFVGLLASAVALAWSGEPVAVVEGGERQTVLDPVELVPIPGGLFRMGSPDSEEGRYNDEGPIHEVRISPFTCMRFPVTRRLYRKIMGQDPGRPEGDADDRPVNNVSWLDAMRFCNELSKREGLTPCYRFDGDGVSWDRTAGGYRLLTEAEWEYACRAGTTTRWSFGDAEELLREHAWFEGNSEGAPQPVGGKRANPWGLHDMHGNVWEWCWDWYGQYSAAAANDPMGPAEGEGRVLRGGAFFDQPRELRSAIRDGFEPTGRVWGIGFRCARGASPP